MADYFSSASTVQSGTTHWYFDTATGGAVISNIYFRFKGISTYSYSVPSSYTYSQSGVAALDGVGVSKTFTILFNSSGDGSAHLGGTLTFTYSGVDSTDFEYPDDYPAYGYDYVYIWLYDSDGTSILEYDYYANAKIGPARTGYFPSVTVTYNIPATYMNTTKYLKFKSSGSLPTCNPSAYGGSFSAVVSYGGYGEVTYTNNPYASCNGVTATVTGKVNNDTWSSWVSAATTMLIGDSTEDITFGISSSLTAVCEFKYTYVIPSPIEEYTSYEEVTDYTTYEVTPHGYATSLIGGTWATRSGLDYGDGSIVLEFKPHVGVTAPATAWKINTSIFDFEYDYEPDKVGTVIISRGTKFAGGTTNALISDWATALTLSASVDTFLLKHIVGGATDLFYTLTDLATANTPVYYLSPNTDTYEKVTVIDAGQNATGRYFKADSTIANDHEKLTEVVAADDATWYFTGSVADVTAWYSTMVTQWEAPDPTTKELDPAWPVKVGSEIIYMYSLPASTTTSLTLKSATWPYRGQYGGPAYSHDIGATVYCVPTVGEYPKSDSLYTTYGPSEAYISPLNVVEGHLLDMMCYNALASSTTAATTARGVMPFTFLPASISVGDWVYIGPFKGG